MSIIIGISGKMGSGKTTLAKLLSSTYDIPIVSFGDYVRSEAKKRDLVESRILLQELGQSMLEKDAVAFCKNVLYSKWDGKTSLIVDGIRHRSVYEIIWQLVAPRKFILIYVASIDSIRLKRLNISSFNNIDNHATEIEITNYLESISDIKINNNDGLFSLGNQIKEMMSFDAL
jgi:dephospho-CoA kinase